LQRRQGMCAFLGRHSGKKVIPREKRKGHKHNLLRRCKRKGRLATIYKVEKKEKKRCARVQNPGEGKPDTFLGLLLASHWVNRTRGEIGRSDSNRKGHLFLTKTLVLSQGGHENSCSLARGGNLREGKKSTTLHLYRPWGENLFLSLKKRRFSELRKRNLPLKRRVDLQ